jgi:ABC-type nitrate/sulfonate/bicarbonate transport system substrate-binding protein
MVNKIEKRVITILVSIVAVVAIIAVAFVGLGSQTAAATGYTIRANVNKDCSGTPFYVGVQLGYFKAGGINFVDQGALDYGLQPAALISGQDDIYDGHPDTIINLLESGAKVTGVAMSGYEPADGNVSEQHMHWLTLASGPYQNIADIKSAVANGTVIKAAVLALGTCADLETEQFFRDNNITTSQYQIVVLSDPYQEAALRSGEIDIAVLHPPFYTAAEQHGGVTILTTSEAVAGPTAGASLLVFTDAFIQAHPDAVAAYIKAYKAAEQWSDDHVVQSGILTAKTIGLTSAKSHWYSYNGTITDSMIQPWIDSMVAAGELKAGQYKPSDLYTTQFSNLWVNESSPQPLNPYGLSTKIDSSWVNQTTLSTQASTSSQTLTSNLTSAVSTCGGATSTDGLQISTNILPGNILQATPCSLRLR